MTDAEIRLSVITQAIQTFDIMSKANGSMVDPQLVLKAAAAYYSFAVSGGV